jgi:HK97 family phage prohead protease
MYIVTSYVTLVNNKLYYFFQIVVNDDRLWYISREDYMHTYTYIMKRAKSKKKQTDTVSFVASSSSPDRYGDIIDQKGWILENYRKNPVVLLNHDSNQLPIGKGHVHLRDGQLVIDVQFDQEDERAREVERKAKAGFMNAVSVGFRPLESKSRSELPEDNKYYGKRGMYYSKSELLEVSIVTIPANGEATMLEQKFYNAMKEELVEEVKSIIKENMFVGKHILSVSEEDDRYIVEFAKMPSEESSMDEEEKEMDKEEEKEMDEEDSEEKEMDKEEEEKYHEEEEKAEDSEESTEEKNFDTLIEAFAYILTSK